MTLSRPALFGLSALLLYGCSQATSNDDVAPDASLAPLLPSPVNFTPATDCTPLGNYRGPASGTTYVYRRQDGSQSSRRIVSADNGRIVFQYRDLSGSSQTPLPDRVALGGLYVTYDEATSPRAVRYRTDPLAALESLGIGQSITIPTTEASTIRGKERSLSFPTVTTYRLCGTLSFQGQQVPVRVYDISTSRRVVDRRGREQVRSSRVTYYLSADPGYPLAYQDTTSTVIERIEPPPYST